MALKEKIPDGFSAPTSLPKTDNQRKEWQDKNRNWWESHPMRYDWTEALGYEEFSPEFYQEIDRRFFTEVRKYMPWKKIPFDPLIDFTALTNKDVLEIGVGNGSHAQLLAARARTFTGIDLTEYAVKSTSKRLEHLGLNAKILRMDAEGMEFQDNSFDFIWSWGVIHHSSNTAGILREMWRVLRPGGNAVVMVYHRNFWNYYVMTGLFHGIVQGDLLKTRSLHETLQRHTDGAIARFYRVSEWETLVAEHFNSRVCIYGAKPEVFPLPAGRFKHLVMGAVPDAATRFLTNTCRLGTFLVSTMNVKK